MVSVGDGVLDLSVLDFNLSSGWLMVTLVGSWSFSWLEFVFDVLD